MVLKLCKLFAFHFVNLMFRPFFTLQDLSVSSKRQFLAVASFRKKRVSRFVTKNAQVIVDYSKRFQKTLRRMSLYILFFRSASSRLQGVNTALYMYMYHVVNLPYQWTTYDTYVRGTYHSVVRTKFTSSSTMPTVRPSSYSSSWPPTWRAPAPGAP